jgi:hypothetical protein
MPKPRCRQAPRTHRQWRLLAILIDGHGGPHPLTHTALAMGCAASDGCLVWSEHIDLNRRPLPADGVLDDPYRIVVSRLDGTRQKVLHRGYLATGCPIIGNDFVTLQTGNSAVVHALTSTAPSRRHAA